MADENGKGPSWSWTTKLLISIVSGLMFLFMSGAAWWATDVWNLASTATMEVIEIKVKLQEISDKLAIDQGDHEKIIHLQDDQGRMQKQLDDLTGIHTEKAEK